MISNFEMFTGKAVSSLETAAECASELGHTYVGTEHILLGFIKEGMNIAAAVLKSSNITFSDLYDKISVMVGKGEETSLTLADMTPALRSYGDQACGNGTYTDGYTQRTRVRCNEYFDRFWG